MQHIRVMSKAMPSRADITEVLDIMDAVLAMINQIVALIEEFQKTTT